VSAFTLFAMASGKGFKTKSSNGKVEQTLHDLEAAFADWEALSDTPEKPAVAAAEAPLTAQQQDVRQKTKKLLSQLREQLAELEE
jgi:hypothetical protein